MGYMEIAILSKSSLRIKSKQASIVVDPQDKSNILPTVLLGINPKEATVAEAPVVINGPGEYETGGIKITGTRSEADMVYSIRADYVDILLGKMHSLDKMQHKLKEYNIVVVLCDSVISASFLTALASNVIMLYGEKAEETAQAFGKDNIKTMSKYSATIDKLPPEVETILLS